MKTKATPYSNLKIFHHTKLLEKLNRGERIAPVYIRIKPTNKCNENCYYCHYKNSYLTLDEYNPKDFIPREKMIEIVSDMKEMGVKAVTFSGGGEPTLYPYINETMEKILEYGIDLSIITNGLLLKDHTADILTKAKWVRVSIDSCDDALYSKLRGVPLGTFSKLCTNIEAFARNKNTDCELGVNFVVGAENYGCIYNMAKLMCDLGVNHVKFAPAINNNTEKYHESFKEQVMNDLMRAKELETDSFRIIDLYTTDFKRVQNGNMIFERVYENCYIKNFVCAIAANSKVYYCHDKAYLSNGKIGDLTKRSFKELWFSKEVTQKFKEFNAQKLCNEHCVFDDRNIMLNQYFSMDTNHVNFL